MTLFQIVLHIFQPLRQHGLWIRIDRAAASKLDLMPLDHWALIERRLATAGSVADV
jgi:hypothetical protein